MICAHPNCTQKAGKRKNGMQRMYCSEEHRLDCQRRKNGNQARLNIERREYYKERNKPILRDLMSGASRLEVKRKYRISELAIDRILVTETIARKSRLTTLKKEKNDHH